MGKHLFGRQRKLLGIDLIFGKATTLDKFIGSHKEELAFVGLRRESKGKAFNKVS
jgi:hypothetical protein